MQIPDGIPARKPAGFSLNNKNLAPEIKSINGFFPLHPDKVKIEKKNPSDLKKNDVEPFHDHELERP